MPLRRRMRQTVLALASIQIGMPAADAQNVALRIETETGRMQFRAGEAIGVTLNFENSSDDATGDGGMVRITGRDRSVLGMGSDRFLSFPENATSDPWKYRFGEGIAYSGPGGMYLRGTATAAHLDLNQWVRFSGPGSYRVRAVFHVLGRERRDTLLESNEIGIEIVAADPSWQAEELRKDVAILTAVPVTPDSETFEARMNAARSIAYLETPASVREAARLLGTTDVQVAQILRTWLMATPLRDDAVAAMKESLINPDQDVTPGFLDTLAALQSWQRYPPAGEPAADPDTRRRYEFRAAAADSLRRELAAAVEQKSRRPRAVSIKTLMDNMPEGPAPAALRSQIATLFLELPLGQQSELLGYQWKKIAGPEMVPALREIYARAAESGNQAPPLVALAVERLYELEPGQTRAVILDEISRPYPRLPYRTLALLSDATLPDLDETLLDHLRHDGGRPVEELISRYATRGILEGVRAFYIKRDSEMRARTSANVPNIASPACEPPLVAYFLRVDPAWGEQALRQSLSERAYPMGRCWISIVPDTAPYYASPEWEKVAIEALRDQSVSVKSGAVQALGRYGSAASEQAVWQALRYWHEWWKDRPAELNEENRRFEQVFVEAIAHAINWTASAGEMQNMKDYCITQGCRAQVEQYRNERRQMGADQLRRVQAVP